VIEKRLADGLALARDGRYFEAHEAFEDAWRAAPPAERDFFQGLVHAVVAWYQDGRDNLVGCTRQLEKCRRRLTPFAPVHRGVDVASVLAQVDAAAPPGLAPLQLPEADAFEQPPQPDVQPPLAVEEEQ
jgi:predicted metal-dependent hydrolase